MEEAFTGGLSSNLLATFGIGSLFNTGLYRGAPLRELVDRFVTPQLIDAVAMESKTGRLLLIVTTNLDIGEAVVWNMGAIAETGGEQARGLFRNILIASASVPGVFPPVMIRVEHGGRAYEEMHADGGASIPFFVAAASPFIAPEQGPDRDVFVIVNGTLSAPQQTTRRNTVAIALQGFTALLYQTFRSELSETADIGRRNRLDVQIYSHTQNLPLRRHSRLQQRRHAPAVQLRNGLRYCR